MPERVLPAPEIFASCPYEGRILEYYAGTFESVYILLHPFKRVVSGRTEEFIGGKPLGRKAIVAGCERVPWSEAGRRSSLPSIAAVDIGLRTLIRGLKPELTNQAYADRIESLEATDGILIPQEGCFSTLLHDDVLKSIQGVGYEWVWVGDEFCTERKLYWIEDLKNQDAGPTLRTRVNVFTPDRALLWTTHWDSHFSFLCSSKRTLDTIQEQYQFEGFFCAANTEVYWSVRC